MTENNVISAEEHSKIDNLEAHMIKNFPVVDLPLVHKFTPGMYIREIFMPAGTLLTSKIHKTEHPYVVLTGSVVVYIPEKGLEYLDAGHSSVTKANTRRALYIEEDCRWVTFHPLSEVEEAARIVGMDDEALVDMVEERILEKRDIPGLEDVTMNELYKALLKEEEEKGSTCLG